MAKDIPSQIHELQAKLEQLKAQQLEELRDKLRDARKVVSDLETEIANVTGKSPSGTRKRTSSAEMHSLIAEVLSNKPKGLSQTEISDETGIVYGSLVAFLRNHPKDFKSVGSRKQKRYLLK
jgi:chromosome segregation ATPase